MSDGRRHRHAPKRRNTATPANTLLAATQARWRGSIQHAVVEQYPGTSADNGIEGDGYWGELAAFPQTDPVPYAYPHIANLTIIGAGPGTEGALLRRKTRGLIARSILTSPEVGVRAERDFAGFLPRPTLRSSVIADVDTVISAGHLSAGYSGRPWWSTSEPRREACASGATQRRKIREPAEERPPALDDLMQIGWGHTTKAAVGP